VATANRTGMIRNLGFMGRLMIFLPGGRGVIKARVSRNGL
jgi:hypothetical protein